MTTIIFDATAVKTSTRTRPFAAGLVELDQHETAAIDAARDRAAAAARRSGKPAERVEAEAGRAAREAAKSMMTLRKSGRGVSDADRAWWAAQSPAALEGRYDASQPRVAAPAPVPARRTPAEASRAMVALRAGLIPAALAEALIGRSLIGH